MGHARRKKSGYFGNPIENRLDDLHSMFRDREVAGVICISGGYGAPQLLDRIDYDLIRNNPKVFAGYSDITALHLAIHKQTGLVTFHGPNLLSPFTEYTREHFRRALFDNKPLGKLGNPAEANPLRPGHPLRAVRPGKATGRLIGGNLTIISTTMGTPYEIDAILGDLQIPVLFGMTLGHTADQMTLPLGLSATLDAAAGTLEITEAGVSRPPAAGPQLLIIRQNGFKN
jgi:muramoyltetrapeptide carboxypeptidase